MTKQEIEKIIVNKLYEYRFRLPKDEYAVVAEELAETIVKNCSTSDDAGQSGRLACDIEKGVRCKDSIPSYKDGKCHNCGGQAN